MTLLFAVLAAAYLVGLCPLAVLGPLGLALAAVQDVSRYRRRDGLTTTGWFLGDRRRAAPRPVPPPQRPAFVVHGRILSARVIRDGRPELH